MKNQLEKLKQSIKSKLRKLGFIILKKTGGFPHEIDEIHNLLIEKCNERYCTSYIERNTHKGNKNTSTLIKLYVDGYGFSEGNTVSKAFEALDKNMKRDEQENKNPFDMCF